MSTYDGGIHNTPRHLLFLCLLFSTLMSPVLPGIALSVIAVSAAWMYRERFIDHDFASSMLLGLAASATIATFVQQTAWGFVSIGCFLLYFAVYGWFKRNVSVTQFVHGLTLMSVTGIAIVLIMVIDRSGGFDFLPSGVRYFFGLESWKPTDSLRSTGTSGNANLAASLLVSLALVAFYKIVRPTTNVWMRLTWTAVCVIYLYGFSLTGTRMAWVAFMAGALCQLWMVYADWLKVRLKQFAFSNAIMFAAMIGGWFVITHGWFPRLSTIGTDWQLRVQIWERALHIFHDNWLFGVLPLHFGELFLQKYGVYEYHAHNMFIGIAVDFGIIGLTLFVLLLGTSLLRGVQWVFWAQDVQEKELAIVLLSIVFGYLGQGLLDYTILVPQTGWLFLLSLGYMHIRWQQLAPLHVRRNLTRAAAHTVHSIPK